MRLEDEPDKPGGKRTEEDPDKPTGKRAEDEPEQKCSACGAARVGVGGFCAGCGKAFAEDEPEGEDEPPPSSKPKPEERASARTAIVRADKGLSLAPLLGIDENASAPAQRQQALDMRAIVTHAAKITGNRDADGILAGLDVLSRDAANARRYRGERDTAKRERDEAVKMSLADRILACGHESYTRADLFADVIDEKTTKRVGVKFADEFAEMSVDRMRNIAERLEAKAPKRDPWQPPLIDDASAKADAANPRKLPEAGAAITEAQITQALSLQAVKQLIATSGSEPRKVARMYLERIAQNGRAA